MNERDDAKARESADAAWAQFFDSGAEDLGARQSPSRTVTHRLLEQLLSGATRPGTRLPGERAMAEGLGVGRSAVREAISALEVLGVVETRAGSGTYLRATSSELLPQTLSWSVLLNRERTEDLMLVRAALECSAAEQAALRGGDDRKQQLAELVDAQERAAGDPAPYVEADIRFHQVLTEMTDNVLLGELLSTIRALLRVWFENAVDSPDDIATAIREHREIAEAVAAGDGAAASAAMDRHMKTAAHRVLRSSEAARPVTDPSE